MLPKRETLAPMLTAVGFRSGGARRSDELGVCHAEGWCMFADRRLNWQRWECRKV